MSFYGISEKDYGLLDALVISRLKKAGAKVYIFGSRAKGDFHPFSDVDLLYQSSKPISGTLLSEIKEQIENSLFPYTVEIVCEADLATGYKADILESRVEI